MKKVQLGKMNTSRLAERARDKQHRIQWDGVSIVGAECKVGQRKFKEASFIMVNKNCLRQASNCIF